MDKIERLLNLTMALLHTTRPLTAEELRERVGGYPEGKTAFHRAFSRDKEDLRELGVPLSVEPIAHTNPPADGYRIHAAEYYLPDPGCAPDELAALHLAAQTARFETDDGLAALWKLGGVTDVDPSVEVTEVPSDPNLAVLWEAVTDRRTVQFTYRDEARTVDPHRLEYARGRWYLVGHDHARDSARNYRLDRIDGQVSAGPRGAFTAVASPPADRAPQPWLLGEGEVTEVMVRVDAPQAPWVVQHLGPDAVVHEAPDGAVDVRAHVVIWPAFRSFVLTFLEHGEVLSPPELRADMISWLEAMAS
jgi:proteasome accessory factor B